MGRRRIGTVSMALVLIAFGSLIFIAQLSKVSAVELGMKFWPFILFLIGGEILWYSYRYKEEEIKIRYDIFSIFMVFIIVSVNLVIYGLIETGVMNRINHMVSSNLFSYQIPHTEKIIDNSIKKIVVNAPNHSKLTVRTEKAQKMTFTGFLDVRTDSEDKAKELLNKEYVKTNKSGDILYISFVGSSPYNDSINNAHVYNLSLILPENKEIEINDGYYLQLIVDHINKNWILDNITKVKVRLDKDLDLKIMASVYNDEKLRGNVKWNIIRDRKEGHSNITGELIYGEGKNKINILNSEEVVVDELNRK